MSKKKSTLETITVESILADRARRQKCLEEIQKLSQELEQSEGSDSSDSVLRDFCDGTLHVRSSGSDSNDVNLEFKNYGHTVFYSGGSGIICEDETFNHMNEDDQYLFTHMLSFRFWNKLSKYFCNRPYNIGKICFHLMTTSPEHADLCKQFLLSDANTWIPSFVDVINAFYRLGASPHCLNIGEEVLADFEMIEDSESAENTKMSDDKVQLIRTVLEYLNFCLGKEALTSENAFDLVIVLSKIGTDKNCLKILHLINSLIDLLLNSQVSFNDFDARNLAEKLLNFQTNTVNKVFICVNVLPRSPRGQLLAVYFAFFIMNDILGIKIIKSDVKNLGPVLDMLHEHEEKIKQLSPPNIYFFTLSLTNIVYNLKVSNFNIDEFTELLTFMLHIKKLPQIQVRDSNLKFISNFVDWCCNLWSFSLDELKEAKMFESPKKSPRKSPKKKVTLLFDNSVLDKQSSAASKY
nr:PREDICTED: uncharacterized protein LOC109036539 isoform X2 [Bemisia tabaci]